MTIVFSALVLLLMVAALADMITLDQSRVQHLPKMAWIIIVILIPMVGVILWFAVGRQYQPASDRGSFGDPRRWAKPSAVNETRPDLTVHDAEAELAALDREIAAQERVEHIRRLEATLEQKRREKGIEA